MRHTINGALLVALLATTARAQAKPSIDSVPAWYRGSKPWNSIGKEGREEILRMRAGYEAYQKKANEPASGPAPSSAAAGKALISQIHTKYGIDRFYHTPAAFGPRMVIWLPEKAWTALSPAQRKSIEAYMSSRYKNWGIGVGSVTGTDIMADRLVVERD